MLVLIDGPEKAGKSTLIAAIKTALEARGRAAEVVHQGPWYPDDRIISKSIRYQAYERTVVYLWDRGWPSEEVYATLLKRSRRAIGNPFMMEWLHGRATTYKFILLPKKVSSLYALRDDTDLPVDAEAEFYAFEKYIGYRYQLLWNDYTRTSLDNNVETVVARILEPAPPPYVYGNPNAKLWFVAKYDNGCKDDRWMPLSYNSAMYSFQEVMDTRALDCAYMFARLGNPANLSGDKIVTAVGQEAAEWVRHYVPASAFPKLHRLNKYGVDAFKNHLSLLKEQML